MTKTLLLIVASLALSTGMVASMTTPVYADDARTSHATVTLRPDSNTKPVKPIGPTDPVDPGNGGTDSDGQLTLDFISDLAFKQDSITNGQVSAVAQNTNAYVQISDRRSTGDGWQLQAKPGVLVGERDDSTINQASLEFGALSFSPAVSTNVSNSPQATLSATQLIPVGSYSLIAQAKKGAGVGTWIMRMNYLSSQPTQLNVLGSAITEQQTYQGTISWLLTDTLQ